MDTQSWKNNIIFCFSKSCSFRNNLLNEVRQMFFSYFFPLWMEWLSQEHSWKTFGRKTHTQHTHTHSLRRWRCLELRITEVQIGSPCQNYSCTKDGTVYQPRAQKDFFRFPRTMQVLRKCSCAVIKLNVLAGLGSPLLLNGLLRIPTC